MANGEDVASGEPITVVLQAGIKAHQKGQLRIAEQCYARVLLSLGDTGLAKLGISRADLGVELGANNAAQEGDVAVDPPKTMDVCEALHLLGAARVQLTTSAARGSACVRDDDDDDDEQPAYTAEVSAALMAACRLLHAALGVEPREAPNAFRARLRNSLGAAQLETRRAAKNKADISSRVVEEAAETLRASLKLEPRFAAALQNLSRALRILADEADKACNDNHCKLLTEERVAVLKTLSELKPNHRCVFYKLGMDLKSLGRDDEAAHALQKHLDAAAEASNADDAVKHGRDQWKTASAQHWLAVIRKDNSATAPSEYVSSLFDFYANKFDEHLVEKLGYQTPQLIATELEQLMTGADQTGSVSKELPANGFDRCADLGCGTGLMGPLLRKLGVQTLEGIDLSEGMLRKALEKGEKAGSYDRLICGDLLAAFRPRAEKNGTVEVEHLGVVCDEASSSSISPPPRVKGPPNDIDRFDLIVAADVFVYIGDLQPVIEASAKWLTSRGLFVFSTEAMTHESSDSSPPLAATGYALSATGRFVHAPDYVRATGEACGFKLVSCRSVIGRYNAGKPVRGHVHVFRLDLIL